MKKVTAHSIALAILLTSSTLVNAAVSATSVVPAVSSVQTIQQSQLTPEAPKGDDLNIKVCKATEGGLSGKLLGDNFGRDCVTSARKNALLAAINALENDVKDQVKSLFEKKNWYDISGAKISMSDYDAFAAAFSVENNGMWMQKIQPLKLAVDTLSRDVNDDQNSPKPKSKAEAKKLAADVTSRIQTAEHIIEEEEIPSLKFEDNAAALKYFKLFFMIKHMNNNPSDFDFNKNEIQTFLSSYPKTSEEDKNAKYNNHLKSAYANTTYTAYDTLWKKVANSAALQSYNAQLKDLHTALDDLDANVIEDIINEVDELSRKQEEFAKMGARSFAEKIATINFKKSFESDAKKELKTKIDSALSEKSIVDELDKDAILKRMLVKVPEENLDKVLKALNQDSISEMYSVLDAMAKTKPIYEKGRLSRIKMGAQILDALFANQEISSDKSKQILAFVKLCVEQGMKPMWVPVITSALAQCDLPKISPAEEGSDAKKMQEQYASFIVLLTQTLNEKSMLSNKAALVVKGDNQNAQNVMNAVIKHQEFSEKPYLLFRLISDIIENYAAFSTGNSSNTPADVVVELIKASNNDISSMLNRIEKIKLEYKKNNMSNKAKQAVKEFWTWVQKDKGMVRGIKKSAIAVNTSLQNSMQAARTKYQQLQKAKEEGIEVIEGSSQEAPAHPENTVVSQAEGQQDHNEMPNLNAVKDELQQQQRAHLEEFANNSASSNVKSPDINNNQKLIEEIKKIKSELGKKNNQEQNNSEITEDERWKAVAKNIDSDREKKLQELRPNGKFADNVQKEIEELQFKKENPEFAKQIASYKAVSAENSDNSQNVENSSAPADDKAQEMKALQEKIKKLQQERKALKAAPKNPQSSNDNDSKEQLKQKQLELVAKLKALEKQNKTPPEVTEQQVSLQDQNQQQNQDNQIVDAPINPDTAHTQQDSAHNIDQQDASQLSEEEKKRQEAAIKLQKRFKSKKAQKSSNFHDVVIAAQKQAKKPEPAQDPSSVTDIENLEVNANSLPDNKNAQQQNLQKQINSLDGTQTLPIAETQTPPGSAPAA